MKILYVATVSGTILRFLIPHIRLLQELGNEVEVACNTTEGSKKEFMDLGLKTHHIDFQRSPVNKKNLKAIRDIRKLVLKEGYDLIHVHTPVASFLTRYACRHIMNLRILYTAHGFHFYKGAPLKNWLLYYSMEKLAARWTDGLITINNEDYNLAKKKMKLRKDNSIFYVHGVGIDLLSFQKPDKNEKNMLREEYGYHHDDFILFYAGELNLNKHQDLLIDVVSLLKSKGINVTLLLAGDGDFRDAYEKHAASLSLHESVKFLGYRSDIEKLLKISDIAVSSSRREGLPVNVMEAMAVGLPAVVSDCRGNRDLIAYGENGYVAGIDDKEGFSEAIELLYNSYELRHRYGDRSHTIIQGYALDRVLIELKSIYSCYS